MSDPITRRRLLAYVGVGSAALTLAACGSRSAERSGSISTTHPGDGVGSPRFESPPEIVGADGELVATLTAAAGMVPHGAELRWALSYNGGQPGPTLRARPGDLLRITLVNGLNEHTNLHFHGLGVSPAGNSDNPFVMVAPGESYDYEVRIPTNHPSGTFWYHPHHHGSVARQVMGGLVGAIVVEDAIDANPVLAEATERVIVLTDPRIGSTRAVLDATAAQRHHGREGDVVLVNGRLRPVASMSARTERWRIVNASPSRYHELRVENGEMTHIANGQARFATGVVRDRIVLAPGQRAEVLVRATVSGTMTLTSTAVDRGATPAQAGGTVVGSVTDLFTVENAVASDRSPRGTTLRDRDPIPDGVVTRTRRITLGASSMDGAGFTIDGRTFDPARTDIEAALGTVEDWVVTNASIMSHPFHVHGWAFQVVGRSSGEPDVGWRDIVDVPAGGWARIRIPMNGYIGRSVYHCHVLDHEDLGMMGVLNVS